MNKDPIQVLTDLSEQIRQLQTINKSYADRIKKQQEVIEIRDQEVQKVLHVAELLKRDLQQSVTRAPEMHDLLALSNTQKIVLQEQHKTIQMLQDLLTRLYESQQKWDEREERREKEMEEFKTTLKKEQEHESTEKEQLPQEDKKTIEPQETLSIEIASENTTVESESRATSPTEITGLPVENEADSEDIVDHFAMEPDEGETSSETAGWLAKFKNNVKKKGYEE